ncbi:MAG TPA: toprim domain-containing protein [Planctomycetota bacterium]|nr:toprim domain-containing protein [Planctomycetota bacterium]
MSKQAPCQFCGRTKWCSVAIDGSIAICMHVSEGARTTTRNGGYLHILKPGIKSPGAVSMPALRIPTDFTKTVEHLLQHTGQESIAALAQMLGLRDPAPLRTLRMFWDPSARAWGFPMSDAQGLIVGIRYRNARGGKFAAKGSQNALFVPSGALEQPGPLYLPEGPTNSAALLQLGLRVVGRACAKMTSRHLLQLCRLLDVVVVADPDKAGREGARALASDVRLVAKSVRIIEPPAECGDARDWVTKFGARVEDVTARALAATPLQLRLAGRDDG